MIVTPTYKLLNLKALPEFMRVFQETLALGKLAKADMVFQFDAVGERRTWGKEQEIPTRVIFGHAQDPESLESATAKAAWLDEAGQDKFKLSSFEAIMRRLSIAQGRVLFTTTIYNLGWLKQKFYDRRHDPDIEIVDFPSTSNPAFPPEEMARAQRDLPDWKFRMFYLAKFTRPAGMIYDCFSETLNRRTRFNIPEDWPRYMGLDFGGVNTAAVKIAHKPGTKQYFVYDEYLEGGRTAAQHARVLVKRNEPEPFAVGGSKSEGQWRQEFAAAGLGIAAPPVADVEVGINRVYGALKSRALIVFDDLDKLLDQILTYSRKLDDSGEPTEVIADKETFHLLDGLRYICTVLFEDTIDADTAKEIYEFFHD